MADTAKDTTEMLSQIDLFAGMSGRELKKMAAVVRTVDHPEGARITDEGRDGLAFHLIVSGEAIVTQGDRELRRLGPGEYFGEISLIDGLPRSASITAGKPMRAVLLDHGSFDKLLAEEPKFARSLLTVLCARLRAAESAH